MTSEPHWSKGPRLVEKRLSEVCFKIKETEVKTGFFKRMIKEGVVTADVRNFVGKQAKLKRVDRQIHAPTARQAMKSKFSDTVASLEVLKKNKVQGNTKIIPIVFSSYFTSC